jgi:acyl carrier protein
MKKLSDLVNNKKIKINASTNPIKNILEDKLVVESVNEDLTNYNINIVGINEAVIELEKEFAIRLIKEQLKMCSNIYNNFRSGQFEYLDKLTESLQHTLNKLQS